jgi:predicted O-methyltransferase YrrM
MLSRRARSRLTKASKVIDALCLPLTYLALYFIKGIRSLQPQRIPFSRAAYRRVGVFPILDRYYEPLFQPRYLKRPLNEPRDLPGLDMNDAGQLDLLSRLRFTDELKAIPDEQTCPKQFAYDNEFYIWGDAELLYSIVRHFKPRRIVEIGSGQSTLLSLKAVARNKETDPDYECEITCVEPYENHWLDGLDVEVVRQVVQDLPDSMFARLGPNDILFIDSSHIIRPQGDVVVEVLTILPKLAPGVLVHVHDVFTPRDYLEEFIVERMRLWNEQYLLEAFLTFNDRYRVLCALNYLKHKYPAETAAAFPKLGERMSAVEPGSFWIVRVS